jgi:hypothetical protein
LPQHDQAALIQFPVPAEEQVGVFPG